MPSSAAKALLPRLPPPSGEEDCDDSSSVDSDGDTDMDCDEADGQEGDDMAVDADGSDDGTAPIAASREQQIRTWARQYRTDDGYTDDPDALHALQQLLEDTGGLYRDLASTEGILGVSLSLFCPGTLRRV